jgi:hypothetical protein
MFAATKAGNPGAERCYGKSIMDVGIISKRETRKTHGFQQLFDV